MAIDGEKLTNTADGQVMPLPNWMEQEYRQLLQTLNDTALPDPQLTDFLSRAKTAWHGLSGHGDFARWQAAVEALPARQAELQLDVDCVQFGHVEQLSSTERHALNTHLQQFHPWRKGPFSLFGIHIDTEWRSDWKWQRLQGQITPLAGRRVLDVGCGSGYHLWRMRGDGASLVIGIDPTTLFAMQFRVFKRYAADQPVFHIPIGIEAMPENWRAFDTVFSMGILYHRRSPVDHLLQLRELLRPGGELVLETLYIEGDEHQCLLPAGRYAKMRNVWFISSLAMLKTMLARAGFQRIRQIHTCRTSCEEQRSTAWMRFESLRDFLDPADEHRTVEGYPAPRRAILVAEA